jgi:hypothetical protein
VSANESWQPDPPESPHGTGDGEEPPPFFYPDLISFYTQHLAPIIRRRDGGGRGWCPQWWRHPEAVARLTALWHAWEALRLEPGVGMSSWWTYHFDPCYGVLADTERGPFQACDRHHSDKLRPLPHDPLPPEWAAAWSEETTWTPPPPRKRRRRHG